MPNILARTAIAFCVAVTLGGCHPRGGMLRAGPPTLVVAVRKEPNSLNPLLLEGVGAYTWGELLYSYLTTYDARGRIVADLARAVPSATNGGISPDGRSVRFVLRHDARWQDGVPVTARDVAFTFAAVMSPANNVETRFGYDIVSRVDTPDRFTAVLRLRRRYAPILSEFLGGDSNYPVLPAHLLASLPNLNAVPFNSSPVGSGPYRLSRWDRGDRIELSANNSYYGGKPGISRLVLPFVADDSTIVNELKTGELDAAFGVDTARVAEVRAIPGRRVIVTPVPYFYAIAFNLDAPPLGDRDVRTAIVQAIDARTLVRKITRGVDDGDRGMRGLFTWAYDPHVAQPRYDPSAAKALLSHDGWIPGRDGLRTKDGQRLNLQLIIPNGSNVTTALATAIAASERAVGIDATVRQYDRNQFISEDGPELQGRYQMSLYDYQGTYDPDASWLLACDQRSPRGFNIARYCSPPVDALLRRAASSYERASRAPAYHAIQRIIAHDVPYDFLCQISEVDVIPSNLSGFVPPLLSAFNFVHNWHLKLAAAP